MPASSASDQLTARLAGVSVRHAGDVVAVSDVTLGIGPGERVALLGPSGSGKTTVLDLLSGRFRPTTGAVEVLGHDPVTELTGGRRRRRAHGRRVGIVRQHGDLALPLRVVHNVNAGRLGHWSAWRAVRSLVRPVERDRVVEVLDRVGLADRVDAVTSDLSGGERQRVAIARVLRQAPDLVLADEPTSSLDPALSELVFRSLAGPGGAPTLVVAAHDPALARRHATRLVGLRDGRIVFDASPSEVGDDDIAGLYDVGASAPDIDAS